MLVEEEEPKSGEVNPDALEALFDEGSIIEEDEVLVVVETDGEDEVDIAFQANDEGYW